MRSSIILSYGFVTFPSRIRIKSLYPAVLRLIARGDLEGTMCQESSWSRLLMTTNHSEWRFSKRLIRWAMAPAVLNPQKSLSEGSRKVPGTASSQIFICLE
jgi:hypothetical protein